ncbi:MAG: hypothetical protein KC621_33990, partial [Myxococcales bacterium]|nr:hypothetical protein [Myxococcales bacterium]
MWRWWVISVLGGCGRPSTEDTDAPPTDADADADADADSDTDTDTGSHSGSAHTGLREPYVGVFLVVGVRVGPVQTTTATASFFDRDDLLRLHRDHRQPAGARALRRHAGHHWHPARRVP